MGCCQGGASKHHGAPHWVATQSCAFDVTGVKLPWPMTEANARKAVMSQLEDSLGYCFHEAQPRLMWIVKRGTVRLSGQAGWTCKVLSFTLPHDAGKAAHFEDGWSGTEEALGSVSSSVEGWARPGRGMGLCDAVGDMNVLGSIDPNDVARGSGSEWLTGTLAALAEHPDVVKAMVKPRTLSIEGKYEVLLYDYGERETKRVAVDDRLPHKGKDRPAFVPLSSTGELWPCLVEKACAKLAGSYGNFAGGYPLFALGMLTGTHELAAFQEQPPGSGHWALIEPAFESPNPGGRRNALGYGKWPDGSEGSKRRGAADVLLGLATHHEMGHLMVCSVQDEDGGPATPATAQGAAHAILTVVLNVAHSGKNMIQVRLPPHAEPWMGDWGTNSELWDENPRVQEALDHVPANDGAYWMEDKDFFARYSLVSVACKPLGKSRTALFRSKKAAVASMLGKLKIPPLKTAPVARVPPIHVPQASPGGASSPLVRSNRSQRSVSFSDAVAEKPAAKPAEAPQSSASTSGKSPSPPSSGSSKSRRLRRAATMMFDVLPIAREALHIGGATAEQLAFFETWCETVHAPSESSLAHGDTHLLVACDLSQVEVGVKLQAATALDLAKGLAEACQLPDMSQCQVLEQAQQELCATHATLWVRIKRLGSDSPAVDAGCSIHEQMEWMLADLLMPNVGDQEALREAAAQEKRRPVSYACSILPCAPERALAFKMPTAEPKSSVLRALSFYRALGLVQPEGAVVHILSGCSPADIGISVAMCSKGLTRLAVRLDGILSTVAEELALCLDLEFKASRLTPFQERSVMSVSVELVAEARGYSVALGFKG